MEYIRIENALTGKTIELELFRMVSFWDNFKGVMFEKDLGRRCYMFTKVRSIHTFFCLVPLDVLFLNREGDVVNYYPQVKPWRVLPYQAQGYYVLEAGAGVLSGLELQPTQRLKLDFYKKGN